MIAVRPLLATLVAAALLLTGCSALSPSAVPSGPTPARTSAPAGMASGGASASGGADDLAAAKQSAGIADCPAADDAVTPRRDGLPDVTLPCLGGGPAVPLAGLRGKPMVINIWAQWCAPCRREAPHLAAVSAAAGSKIDFLGIDYDDPDPLAAIEYAGRVGWHYPQLQDQGKTIKPGLQILGPPQTVFVTADGRIAYRHNGPFGSAAELRTAIGDHLGVRL